MPAKLNVQKRFAALAKRFSVSEDDLRDLVGERAAIREYDGGMTRKDAEQAALDDAEELLSR